MDLKPLIESEQQNEKSNDSSAFESGARPQFKPTGSSGTELFAGYFSEEYLQNLRGKKGAKIFDEMRRSEPQIAMLLNAVMNPIKAGVSQFEAAQDVPDGQLHKEFIEFNAKEAIDWETHLHEALTFLMFGFSLFEVVHSVVIGHEKFGTFNGLKALAFRGQKTIERWIVERATGQLTAVEQWTFSDPSPQRAIVQMDSKFLLVFTLQKEGDNFEGVSALRPMYGPWFRKNLYLKIAAIGIEKSAIGTPIGTVPAGKEKSEDFAQFKTLLENFTAHENAYIIKPEGWDIEILKSEFDAEKVKSMIVLENTEMINSLVANFLALGTSGGSGSFALGTDLSDFFLTGIQNYANIIAGVWNRKLIPDLIKMNFGPQKAYPKLKFTGINDKAGKELAEIISSLTQSEAIKPDMPLEEFLRKQYSLPKADPTTSREPAAKPMLFSEELELGGPGSGPQGGEGGKPVKGELMGSGASNEQVLGDYAKRTGSKELKAVAKSDGTFEVHDEHGKKSGLQLRRQAGRVRLERIEGDKPDAIADAARKDAAGDTPARRAYREAQAKNKLSEVQLAENYKKDWKTNKDKVKAVMQSNLSKLLEGYSKQVRSSWKNSTANARRNLALQLTPPSLTEYKKELQEMFAEIANDALLQAQKETPKARKLKIKLSETIQLSAPKGGYFDSLPKNIKNIVKNAAGLIAQTQAADLNKFVSFTFLSSADTTDNADQVTADIAATLVPVVEDGATGAGLSIDAAAGNAVSTMVNQARLEWFFEPEVLATIESFTFFNEDPVSEICNELDGMTWAVGDPDIDRYTPPLHHNCKSRLQVNEKGAEGNPKPTRGGTPVSKKALDSITLHDHCCGLNLGPAKNIVDK